MATTITPERDRRNKQMIAMSFFNYMGAPRSAKQLWLLNDATPEERDTHVRKQNKRLLVIVALVAGYLAISSVLPRDAVPPPPSPEITGAGVIQSLQLHETALSTSTTVITETGTYQVRGGVSAAKGDSVSLKREVHPYSKVSLCIESKIKTQCYQLL